MAVSWARGAVLASLGVLVACSDEPNFDDGASGGQGTGATSSGGSASGGSASGGSASGGSASGGSASGGSGSGGAFTGGGPPGGGGPGGGPVGFCGDGAIDGPQEQCDDGNPADDDGCTGCVVDCPQDGYADPVTFHCYFRIDPNDWTNRRQECVDSAPGTDAAALSTLAEYDAVAGAFEQQGFTNQLWIGGQKDPNNDVWSWSNGEPWIYADGLEPWAATSPSNNGDCTRINPKDGNREMRDDNCGENKPMICERTPLGS